MSAMKRLIWVFAALAAVAALPAVSAAADGSAGPCASATNSFALSLRALADATDTELVATVAPITSGCAAPERLKHVQLKTFGADGRLVGVDNSLDDASPGGRASFTLPSLAHGRRLAMHVQFSTEQTQDTVVLDQSTSVLLRPDLDVTHIAAPSTVMTDDTFEVSADVSELNGDVGEEATVHLTRTDTGAELGSAPITVAAGGTAHVAIAAQLPSPERVPLALSVVATGDREVTTDNNTASAVVESVDARVDSSAVILQFLAGFGAQFNQSLFWKKLNPKVPPGAPDLKEKVDTLEPQLTRIFFPREAFTDVDRMASFRQVVQMAQDAGAIIEITWSGGFSNIDSNMSRLAGVLADLVNTRGITNLRWVSLLNEPNGPDWNPPVPMDTYKRMYQTLDTYLTAAGVRDRIRFMGGELVQTNQRAWFDYMIDNMSSLLDAYSIHIYWDYWDTAKLEARLADVRSIDLRTAPKPIYVTEFGVRGIRKVNGVTLPQPGVWQDLTTPMAQSNVTAFQLGWFNILASQSAYPGTIIWDAFNAKYDNGTQDFSCIGPAPDFPLRPCYSALRLFTATTERNWRVLAVDRAAGTKLLGAYAGDVPFFTVIGLDRAGGQLNDNSGTPVPYGVAGLPPSTQFQLVVWNGDGTGTLGTSSVVTTDALGVAFVTVPAHAIWALTTHPIDD